MRKLVDAENQMLARQRGKKMHLKVQYIWVPITVLPVELRLRNLFVHL
jgi:hypothetical protein